MCLKDGSGNTTTTTTDHLDYYYSSSSGNSSATTNPPPLPSSTITVLRSYFVFTSCFVEVRKLVLVFILFHTRKLGAKFVTSFLKGCNISL